MPQQWERARPKISLTVDASTIATINNLLETKRAKSTGEAVDILANHFRLTTGATPQAIDDLEKAMASNIEAQLQERWSDFIGSTKQIAHDLVAVAVGNLREEQKAEVFAPIQQDNDAFERLVSNCPSGESTSIEKWAEGWRKEIEATGHSIFDLVSEKVMRQNESRVKVPGHVVPLDTAVNGDAKRKEVIFNLADRMKQHWVGKLGASSTGRSKETTEFYVAFSANKFINYQKTLENGQKEALSHDLMLRVKEDARVKGWKEQDYISEFERILSSSPRIIEEYGEKTRKGELN